MLVAMTFAKINESLRTFDSFSSQVQMVPAAHLELEDVRGMCLTHTEAAVLVAPMPPFPETPCCKELVKE